MLHILVKKAFVSMEVSSSTSEVDFSRHKEPGSAPFLSVFMVHFGEVPHSLSFGGGNGSMCKEEKSPGNLLCKPQSGR